MIDVARAVIDYKAAASRVYPCRANRASEAGHSCERYLVYCRTNWRDRPAPSGELMMLFAIGNDIEERALRDLKDAGFVIEEQQKAFEWKEYEITGHLDAILRHDDKPYPIEIKGLQPFDWEKLEVGPDGYFSIDTFLKSKKSWIKKYPAQLTLYLMGDARSETGLFYIVNKLTGAPKAGWFALDYEYAESIIKKLERVNEHVEAGTLPEQTDDISLCEYCDFLSLCLPEMRRSSLAIDGDPELAEKLDRYHELKPAKAEYEAIDRYLKERLDGVEKAICGDYMITGKRVDRKGYTVPESSYWSRKIARIDEGEPA